MPTSAAPDRSAPHPQVPWGRWAICSSGSRTHAKVLPGAPGCLPRDRPDPFARRRAGFVRPGRSSVEGGIEEFPLLRPTARSSAATRSGSRTFAALNSSISPSRNAHATHSDDGGNCPGTAA
jgi:hypothetical protein